MSSTVTEQSYPLLVPMDVAKCPICGMQLCVEDVDIWTQDLSGNWRIEHAEFSCTSEPDIDSPDWHEWFAGHYRAPYVDWMPLDEPVIDWLNKRAH